MLRRGIGILVAAASVSLALTGVAHAEPESPDAHATDVVAMKCLKTRLNDDGPRDHLWVKNKCKKTISYKVIIAHGPDSNCTNIKPGARHHWRWGWPGGYDGLKRC